MSILGKCTIEVEDHDKIVVDSNYFILRYQIKLGEEVVISIDEEKLQALKSAIDEVLQ
jgi:hypothetical protein